MQTIIPADRRQRIQDLGYDYTAQPRDLVMTCNLCGSNVLVTITHRDRYGYPAQASACDAPRSLQARVVPSANQARISMLDHW